MRKTLLTLSVLGVALVASTAPVTAQSVDMDQDATASASTETRCTTLAYGQVECVATADADASASQSLTLGADDSYVYTKDGRLIHVMADTGLDQTGLIATFGLMASGSVAAINKFKNRG